MKKIVIGLIATVFFVATVSATGWAQGEEWKNSSKANFACYSNQSEHATYETPYFPKIIFEKPQIFVEKPEKPVMDREEKINDSINDSEDELNESEEEMNETEDEVEEFTGSLTFQDQVLSNGSVTVEDVTTGQDSTLIITYEQDGELVVAGLESTGETSSEDIDVLVEDADGFPGLHTAHVIATEELSTDYTVGETVSEETAEDILDSETANITEQEEEPIQPTGQLDFTDQNLSEDSTVTVENVSTGQESTLVLTYPNQESLTIAGLEPADNLETENIEVSVEDAAGFPGNHTSHIIPDEGLSSDYIIGDNVSEETASNILESETALIQ